VVVQALMPAQGFSFQVSAISLEVSRLQWETKPDT